MPDMQRPGRVAADEFDLHFFPLPDAQFAILIFLRDNRAQQVMPIRLIDKEIQEARPRDFAAPHRRIFCLKMPQNCLRDFTRRALFLFCQLHRNGGGEIPLFFFRRTPQHDFRQGFKTQIARRFRPRQRLSQHVFHQLFHTNLRPPFPLSYGEGKG